MRCEHTVGEFDISEVVANRVDGGIKDRRMARQDEPFTPRR